MPDDKPEKTLVEHLMEFPGMPPKDPKKNPLGIMPIDLTMAFGTKPPPLDFVLPGLVAGTVGVVVSPGGVGKSMLMLESALSVGMGEDVGGIWGEAPHRGRVVYLAGEDPREVLERRLHALGFLLNTDAQEYAAAEMVEVLPAYGLGITVANNSPVGIVPSRAWETLEQHLIDNPARLLILDTLNRLLGGISENDSGAMGAVLSIIEQTCRKVGCAVIIVHHANKASMSSGTGTEQHAARGSSAITDNARWQVNLTTMGRDEAEARGIEDDAERRGWVRLDLAKVNYGPPIAERWLKRGMSGELAAGDPPAKIGKQNKASRKSRAGDDVDDDSIPF